MIRFLVCQSGRGGVRPPKTPPGCWPGGGRGVGGGGGGGGELECRDP